MSIRGKVTIGFQILIVLVTSLITASNPYPWCSAVFLYGSVIVVPLLSKNFALNLAMSLFHVFVLLLFALLFNTVMGVMLLLLAFIHLFDPVMGSVVWPIPDLLPLLIIIVFYTGAFLGRSLFYPAERTYASVKT
ncbi:MAG: hypothetical protein QM703_13680 [Gemmatales bacterium]